MKKYNFIKLGFCILFITSCSKLVEVAPPITSTNGNNVFDEDGNAIAVLTGIYNNMSKADINIGQGWLTNIGFVTGLTGDELEPFNKSNEYLAQYFTNKISSDEQTWAKIYRIIFLTNSAIESLPTGILLTSAVRNQLLGEAKFLRALSYFYLINIYGDVPLAVSTDYKVNGLLPRTSSKIVYQQIISDLQDAQNLLNINYVGNDAISITTERIRPNKWVATALLARIYLYTGKYVDAESQANSIINNSGLYNLVDLDNVFLMNNQEAIWQLQPVGVESGRTANTRDGQVYNLQARGIPSSYIVNLTDTLVNSFDIADQRKYKWINNVIISGKIYYYPYKYKIGLEKKATAEYSTVFRLGEQYLIRAEARIQQGNINGGIADLNKIRLRATDLTATPVSQLAQLSSGLSKLDALSCVEKERKYEFFTEWGHRWFDLKRTNRIDVILKNIKLDWQSSDQLFPLPASDIYQNPNLKGHQNPGYN
jgi:tetratricopeptide (TPR) repeat protein